MSRVTPRRIDGPQAGFTIIEVLIALAVVAVCIVSIGSAMSTNARGVRSLEQHVALMQTARRLRLAIGIMLLTSSAHAAALASLAVADPLDVSEAQDARAGSPAASAIWARSAGADQVQVVTAPAAPPPAQERALSANPLWAVPLTALSGTRDRPIFSASRRPLPPAVAPAATIKAVAAPKPKEPERPKFSLVGTIASGDEGFGIFLDQSTREAIRLRIGEDYQGWRLRSVQGREATLEKDQQVVTLALPQPGT